MQTKSCFTFRNSSSIHIENLVFTECFSEDSDGGALFVSEADVVNISQCSFVNNYVRKRGGAIRLQQIGRVHVQETSFVNNSAICHPLDIFSYLGSVHCLGSCTQASSGAISAFNVSSFVIIDSLFEGSMALCFSGAVLLSSSHTSVINSKFVQNSVTAALGSGGGLYIDSGSVQISDSIFEQNYADSGGAIYSSSSTIYILNCSLVKNTAGFYGGGAAYFSDTILSINVSHFGDNTAHIGGALIIQANGQDTVISSTFFQRNANPKSSSSGGAIYIQLSGAPSCTVSCLVDATPTGDESVVSIVSCIFDSNKGWIRGGAIDVTGGVLNVTNSILSKNSGLLGGAIFSNYNILYLQRNNFTANNSSAFGGAVYLAHGTVYSDNNRYSNNEVFDGGAAVEAFKSTMISKSDQYISNIAHQGSGAVFVTEGTLKSNESFYEANYANRTGAPSALYLIGSQASFNKDAFYRNLADSQLRAIPGAGVHIIFSESNISQYQQVYAIQLTNSYGNCRDLTFIGNTGSMYLFSSKLGFSGNTIFTSNTGITGGALTIVQSTVKFNRFSNVHVTDNQGSYGGGIFVAQSILRVHTPNLKIDSNIATISGGGIFVHESQFTINTTESSDSHILVTRNSAIGEGGALFASTTSLFFVHVDILLTNNNASKGGAIFFSENSKIFIKKTLPENFSPNQQNITKIMFSNNSAEYGGAIYVNDHTSTNALCQQPNKNPVQAFSTDLCFIQILRLYYLRVNTIENFNYINVFFQFNIARHFGNDIFGGLLDRCQTDAFSEIRRNFRLDNYNGFDYLKTIAAFQVDFDYFNQTIHPFRPQLMINHITREHIKHLISSDPVQICFCENNIHNCSYQWPTIFTMRGLAFTVEAITVDQVENPVNGVALASVLSSGTRLKVDQSQQIINGVCTDLTYNVFSTEQSAYFELYPDGPCGNMGISSKKLKISFLPCDCPNGLQPAALENECRCECDLFVERYVSSCQLSNNNITVVKVDNIFWIQYINAENVTGFQFQRCPYDYCLLEPVNLSITLPLNVDKQCAYNRTGIMCGECEEGLSLVFGSSRCVQCSNNYLALLAAFAFAGVALVTIILILNMTVAVGTIHGLILYANLIGANSPIFLPTETVLRFFVFWVNLELGIETCFYDGMDSYAKVLLQLVFPMYIILLSALIIIVSNYWGWFAGLIGRKNPVATLCTLFLLSYSKLLRNIIAGLQYTHLTYPDGSKKILWTFDPNIPYLILSRTPFFLIAIIIIVVGGFYTILLFFWSMVKKIFS